MENLLIVPKNKEEFSFLQELLQKLNIAMQVVSPEVWENEDTQEVTTEALLSMPVQDRKAYLAMEAQKALSFYTENNDWKELQGLELIDYRNDEPLAQWK